MTGCTSTSAPDAANKTLLLPSASAHVVMGHVRMTTQGNAQSNYNNHPFPGNLDGHLPGGGPDFALAHNGVLNNDLLLRHQLHLPKTRIETDSYIAVQMLASAGHWIWRLWPGLPNSWKAPSP